MSFSIFYKNKDTLLITYEAKNTMSQRHKILGIRNLPWQSLQLFLFLLFKIWTFMSVKGYILKIRGSGEILLWIDHLPCTYLTWVWSLHPIWSTKLYQEWYPHEEPEVSSEHSWLWPKHTHFNTHAHKNVHYIIT